MKSHIELGGDESVSHISKNTLAQYNLQIPSQLITRKNNIIQQNNNNGKHYGHQLNTKDKHTLRIYFQDMNGIATIENMHSYIDKMNKREADIWGWAETNVNWTKNLLAQTKYYGNKILKTFHL